MIDVTNAPYAAPVLRVFLGSLFLPHVSVKLFVFKPAGTAQYLSARGLRGR